MRLLINEFDGKAHAGVSAGLLFVVAVDSFGHISRNACIKFAISTSKNIQKPHKRVTPCSSGLGPSHARQLACSGSNSASRNLVAPRLGRFVYPERTQ